MKRLPVRHANRSNRAQLFQDKCRELPIKNVENMMIIQPFTSGIEQELWEVCHTAIKIGCVNDYSCAQLSAWSPDECNLALWKERIHSINPFTVKIGNKFVGYADLQADGYIDHFYVHGEYQHRGVGKALMNFLLQKAENLERVYSHVSITARPFYERHGFVVMKEQEVEVRGQKLKNFVMEYRK